MHEHQSKHSCITSVIHESRFLRQTRLDAEIVGLTRIYNTQATPSQLKILYENAPFYN